MNDPRITAYALGELTGRAREKFERDLAKSDSLHAEFNDIIAMAMQFDRLPISAEGFDPKTRIDLLHACAENQAERQRNKKTVLVHSEGVWFMRKISAPPFIPWMLIPPAMPESAGRFSVVNFPSRLLSQQGID
jgi:hypothetical protein